MPDMSYREQLDQKRLQTIRDMLLTLPRSCADFVRSLQATASMLTRLAYTIDLTTFFTFAMQELPGITAKTATDITDADIAALKPRDIEIYAEYLSLYIKQIGEDETVQRELRNQTYGIMRKLSSLRSFFNYLFRTQRIPANIVSLVPLPKLHDKPILLLEREEMHQLLTTIETGAQLTPRQTAFHNITQARDMAIVMLFLGTGIRVSECVGVNLEDVDWKVNALLVTRKGGNQVILYFPREVAQALRHYLQQREAITPLEGHEHAFFLSLQRRRITQRAVELMVKKYAMLVVPLKRRMSPHKLRSTYATNLYEATQDIYLVAETLGHADVNTTRKHYASMSAARMRQAASNTHLRKDAASQPEDDEPVLADAQESAKAIGVQDPSDQADSVSPTEADAASAAGETEETPVTVFPKAPERSPATDAVETAPIRRVRRTERYHP